MNASLLVALAVVSSLVTTCEQVAAATTTTTAAASTTATSSAIGDARRQKRRLDQQQQQADFEENYYYNGDGDDNAYFQYDLSQYSVRFEKCQYVKMYDDEVAEDEDSDSPLALKHFVLYKLCPTSVCSNWGSYKSHSSSSGSTASVVDENGDPIAYGKYVVDVETFLQSTVQHQQRTFENLCANCGDGNNNNNNGGQEDCNENNGGDGEDGGNNNCQQEQQQQQQQQSDECDACYKYQNLENNGYIDASAYTECQKLDIEDNNDGNDEANENGDDGGDGGDDDYWTTWKNNYYYANYNNDDENNENNNEVEIYIGPRCNTSGKIVIGLFFDENCWEPIDDLDVEQVLGAKLSYYLLRHSYPGDENEQDNGSGLCLSCKEDNDNNNDDEEQDQEEKNDEEDADDVNEMCENLYNEAAKCESETGLEVGFIQTARGEDGDDDNNNMKRYENQVENEFLACTFINSLIWNSYTETGEININEPQDEIIRRVTKKQAIALSLLSCTFIGLVALMYHLDGKIKAITDQHTTPLVVRGNHSLT